jgi:5-methylcytosine-specific restriction endonuclease McrA
MPMNRTRYPDNWSEIAFKVKQAAAWCCRLCEKQCRRPTEQFDTQRNTLTVHHIDGHPENNAPDNLIAVCAPCTCSSTPSATPTMPRSPDAAPDRPWINHCHYPWRTHAHPPSHSRHTRLHRAHPAHPLRRFLPYPLHTRRKMTPSKSTFQQILRQIIHQHIEEFDRQYGPWPSSPTPPSGDSNSEAALRGNKKARTWKKAVLERDGHRCTQCGSTERLAVHHLAPWANAPELRCQVDNGVTLCVHCHGRRHGGGK